MAFHLIEKAQLIKHTIISDISRLKRRMAMVLNTLVLVYFYINTHRATIKTHISVGVNKREQEHGQCPFSLLIKQ